MGWGKTPSEVGISGPTARRGPGAVVAISPMKRRGVALTVGGLVVTGAAVVAVLALTHGPATAPAEVFGSTPAAGATTSTEAPLPAIDPASLRALLPSVDDLAGTYSGGKLRSISKSGVRAVAAGSVDFGASSGVLGGVEQVYDGYNSYYQSDTTIVVRVALFRSRDAAAAFVAGYDKPSRIDNETTRDSVPVSTFEYAQAGRRPSAAESMAAVGNIVVWVKIVDSDELSIYTGIAFLIVEDAVVEAIDTFPGLTGD